MAVTAWLAAGRGRETGRRRPWGYWAVLALALWVALPSAARAQSVERLLDQARQLHLEGQWREAVSAYVEVAVLAREGDPASAGVALNNACDALNSLGDYRAAAELCGRALQIRRGLGDEQRLARTLNNLGVAQQYLGQLAQARASFEEALAINRRLEDPRGEGINLANLGLTATAGERYGEAMSRFEEAAALARQHAGLGWAASQENLVALNRGVVLERVGAFREALDLYRSVAERLGEEEPWRRAALEVNIGVVYRNLGDPVRAVEAFEQAAVTYARLGDTAGRANALLNLALALHLNLARPGAAAEAFEQALAAAREAGDRAVETDCLLGLATLRMDQGEVSVAEQTFRQAEVLARDSGAGSRLGLALHGLARVDESHGELGAARERLIEAMAAVEAVRAGLERDRWREGISGGHRRIYATAVRVLAAMAGEVATGAGTPEGDEAGKGLRREALEVVQRAKARELVESLAAKPGAGSPVQEPSPVELPSLPVRSGAEVLEYFLADGELYGWRIDSTIDFRPLGAAKPILEAAGRVHAALAIGDEPAPSDLRELSTALLAPLLPAGDARELFIAPDGALRYLPFELLPDPAQPRRPLVARTSIAYLPSASALARLPHEHGTRAITLLALGDPRLPAADAGFDPAALLVDRFSLERLPAARGEIERIAAELPGGSTLLVDADASEAALRRGLGAGARVIHLATHTVVDERPGRGAAILLAAGDGEDGVLRPEEIAATPWPADLTVLAACRSALASDGEATALGSLTGALLSAGSSAVIASLWDVDDAATAVFMEQLYDRLGRGQTPARALREVKQALRAEPGWDRPSLWAAFVLIGDAPPVARSVPRHWWSAASLAGGLLLAGLALLLALRARRSSS